MLFGLLPLAGWIFLPLLATGAWSLWQRTPILAKGALALLIAQFVGLWISKPVGLTGVLGRYYLMVWPLALMLAAAGITASVEFLTAALRPRGEPRSPGAAAEFLTVAIAVGLAVQLPLRSPMKQFLSEPSSFRTSKMMLNLYDHMARSDSFVLQTIMQDPDGGELVLIGPILPVRHWSRYMDVELPGKRVQLATRRSAKWREQGIRLEHELPLHDMDALRSTGAQYFVANLAETPAALLEVLRKQFGPPVCSDERDALFLLNASP
ncbi:MAG: hypothetical protein ACI9EF_001515 [Pseudohongiellaceae bacterium]|jgi:hypothetical protein